MFNTRQSSSHAHTKHPPNIYSHMTYDYSSVIPNDEMMSTNSRRVKLKSMEYKIANEMIETNFVWPNTRKTAKATTASIAWYSLFACDAKLFNANKNIKLTETWAKANSTMLCYTYEMKWKLRTKMKFHIRSHLFDAILNGRIYVCMYRDEAAKTIFIQYLDDVWYISLRHSLTTLYGRIIKSTLILVRFSVCLICNEIHFLSTNFFFSLLLEFKVWLLRRGKLKMLYLTRWLLSS